MMQAKGLAYPKGLADKPREKLDQICR